MQIAWVVYDRAGDELSARCEYLALPPGRKVNVFARRVHGISDATLRASWGWRRSLCWPSFRGGRPVVAAGGRLVAHNAAFDAQVVSNTAESCGLARDLLASECLCTMELSKHRLGLRNRRGALKPPKNAELYAHLVGIELDDATLHDALADVRVTDPISLRARSAGGSSECTCRALSLPWSPQANKPRSLDGSVVMQTSMARQPSSPTGSGIRPSATFDSVMRW